MRLLLLIIFSFLTSIIFGQNRESIKSSRFRIGLEIAIINANIKIEQSQPNSPIPEASFSIQSNIYYKYSNKLSLYTGIAYRRFNQVLYKTNITIPYSENQSTIDANGMVNSRYDYSFYSVFGNVQLDIQLLAEKLNKNHDFQEGDLAHFGFSYITAIESVIIPIGLQYNLRIKKNKLFIRGGGSIGRMNAYRITKQQFKGGAFLTRRRVSKITVKDFSVIKEQKYLNKFIPELFVSSGFESEWQNRFSLFGHIIYTVSLTPYYSDGIINTHFNTLGFSVGTTFSF